MLVLKKELQDKIKAHLESFYPEEACGLILGKMMAERLEAVEIVVTRNVAIDRTKNYSIAPEDMLKTQKEARELGLEIIGVYHSHPDNPAVPSEVDRELAWTGYIYLIASLKEGKIIDIRGWRLDDNERFYEESITRM